eukprot:TRINITY_DN11015_c0_g1_i3.p1 TRINITY_DN11015_c0_g1~~TRINITY_DN11015_c0_g1_i3.p1  ORF type:complete len:359 (+),score=-4.17 TRINITY_DN11015_c0_g1_i3:49-1125(+)
MAPPKRGSSQISSEDSDQESEAVESDTERDEKSKDYDTEDDDRHLPPSLSQPSTQTLSLSPPSGSLASGVRPIFNVDDIKVALEPLLSSPTSSPTSSLAIGTAFSFENAAKVLSEPLVEGEGLWIAIRERFRVIGQSNLALSRLLQEVLAKFNRNESAPVDIAHEMLKWDAHAKSVLRQVENFFFNAIVSSHGNWTAVYESNPKPVVDSIRQALPIVNQEMNNSTLFTDLINTKVSQRFSKVKSVVKGFLKNHIFLILTDLVQGLQAGKYMEDGKIHDNMVMYRRLTPEQDTAILIKTIIKAFQTGGDPESRRLFKLCRDRDFETMSTHMMNYFITPPASRPEWLRATSSIKKKKKTA